MKLDVFLSFNGQAEEAFSFFMLTFFRQRLRDLSEPVR